MTKQELIAASTATPSEMKDIIAELNAHVVYGKRKRTSK